MGGIKDEIEYYEIGTPKTIKRHTLNPEGTAYGFAQIPSQSGRKRIAQKSPVENLYFASAWTMPGLGFTGVILSGYWCAGEILKQNRNLLTNYWLRRTQEVLERVES